MDKTILNRIKELGQDQYDKFTAIIATPDDWQELRDRLSHHPWPLKRLPLLMVIEAVTEMGGVVINEPESDEFD